jgi:hypothetical protein
MQQFLFSVRIAIFFIALFAQTTALQAQWAASQVLPR